MATTLLVMTTTFEHHWDNDLAFLNLSFLTVKWG